VTATASAVERIGDAVRSVRSQTDLQPEVAIILGTGLSGLAGMVDGPVSVDYRQIPGFPEPTVETHPGRLVLGTLEGRKIAVMQGRTHLYEGYDARTVTFPVRVLRALGADCLVVANVSGGMHPLWAPGDLVLISDHINLLSDNPLVGSNAAGLGPRFPDLSEAYDRELAALAREEALRLGIRLREGVYVAVRGPCLETAAEYRMLRALGADIVGMSTVPEVIAARHGGMRVLGLSIITDACLPDALEPADINAIVQIAAESEPLLTRLVRAVLARA
jgi:purine-nucleoside phosphorylase